MPCRLESVHKQKKELALHLDLSIVTCTFNSEFFLDEMLDSVRSQTHFPKEHIFVDGNSEDGTDAALHRYSKLVPYPVYIIKQNPNGISSAMNLGSRKSNSNFIMHLHSDDKLYSPSSLQKAMDLLDVNDSKWLFGRCEYIDVDGTRIAVSPQPSYSRKRLLASNFVSHPSVVISKDLFLKVGGFDESLRIAMDYDLWLKVSEIADPIQTDLVLSSFRIHQHGASSASRVATSKEDFRVRIRHLHGKLETLLAVFRYVAIRILIQSPVLQSSYMRLKVFRNNKA